MDCLVSVFGGRPQRFCCRLHVISGLTNVVASTFNVFGGSRFCIPFSLKFNVVRGRAKVQSSLFPFTNVAEAFL